MEHFSWSPSACYGHLHRLADTGISIKGDDENSANASVTQMSPERKFFQSATDQRLKTTDLQFLVPNDEDLMARSKCLQLQFSGQFCKFTRSILHPMSKGTHLWHVDYLP